MTTALAPAAALDLPKIRGDFPALSQEVHGKELVYLDNAASAQKPQAVIDAVARAYAFDYSNVHRGVHTLSQNATNAYEAAREKIRAFLGAPTAEELIFVRGTSEGINLVAQSYARPRLQPGDEILISEMEHHSNIVPWQIVCEQTGAKLVVAPINDRGELLVDAVEERFSDRTKIVALVHVSNALGTINPVSEIIEKAHARGVPVLLDGAQAAPHEALDLASLGADFYTISGHKLFGPTGIGVLYGRRELLDAMEPYQGGGEMILTVSFEKTEYNEVPHKFEAGTPHIVGAIGLGAACDYLQSVGMDAIASHEHELLEEATARLSEIPGLRMIGTAAKKAAVISFVLDGVHAHDVGTILDQEGVAVRVGHHCAQPVMERFGVAATARASFAFYNSREEIDRLVAGIGKVQEIFGR